MQKVKIAELVLDYAIYPRNNVDDQNVRYIMDAMNAGEVMPPVIVDRKTKRIVDGFHRTIAARRMNPEGEIAAVFKEYRSEGELFLDAIRYNAKHGARLDSADRTRCLLMAERLSIAPEAVAGALNMPIDKLANLKITRVAKTSGGLAVPLKRTFQHMAGKRLSTRQIEANTRSSGMNQVFYANQLIDMIESGMLDRDDEKLMERLARLRELLDGVLQEAMK